MWSILFFISVTVLVHPPALFLFLYRTRGTRGSPFPFIWDRQLCTSLPVSPSRFLPRNPISLRHTRLSFLSKLEEEKTEDQEEYRRGNQRGRCIFVGTLPPPRNAPVLSRYTRNTRERCRTIVSGALKFPRLHAPVDPPSPRRCISHVYTLVGDQTRVWRWTWMCHGAPAAARDKGSSRPGEREIGSDSPPT